MASADGLAGGLWLFWGAESPAWLGPSFDLLLLGGVLSQVRRWWSAAPTEPRAPVPYEVVCACGQTVTGFRKAEHQVVRCTHCGDELFILPVSRLPEVVPSKPAGAAPARARLRPWALPLCGAGAALLALVAAYWFVVRPWTAVQPRPDGSLPPAVERNGEALAAHLEAARKRMGLGHFRLALEELLTARALCERRPDVCPPARRRDLAQLARQAALMVDLLAEPIEGVLRHAAETQDAEWQAEFRQRYRGKAVLFDVSVRPLGENRYEAAWELRVHDERARLEVSDLDLLRRLDLNGPQRLLFGARLASVRREAGGRWVVRLEPDSGVLVTEPAVALACFYDPEEAGVRALLRRQATWAADSGQSAEP